MAGRRARVDQRPVRRRAGGAGLVAGSRPYNMPSDQVCGPVWRDFIFLLMSLLSVLREGRGSTNERNTVDFPCSRVQNLCFPNGV